MNGLLTQKPGREPVAGETKLFVIEQRTSASGKAWTKVKNATADQGGQLYLIKSVKPTGFEDSHGNVSYNVDIEPSTSAPQSRENAPQRAQSDDARHYLMRAANLLKMCHSAAAAVIGPDYDGEDARTLFIASSREGYIKEMPDKPISAEPEPEDEPTAIDINGEEESF